MKNIHWLCGPEQAKVLLLGFKPCKISKSQNTTGAVRTGKSPVLTPLPLRTVSVLESSGLFVLVNINRLIIMQLFFQKLKKPKTY